MESSSRRAAQGLSINSKSVLAGLALLGLAACTSTGGPAHPPKTTPTSVLVQCLPQANYTRAFQVELANELAALPPAALIRVAVRDYGAMRDANRACKREPNQ